MIFLHKIKSFNLTLLLNYIIGFFYTKLFYTKAKLIRRPFYLRNEGKFIFERGFSLGPSSLIEIFGCKSKLIIGKNFSAYVNLHIGCCNHISIGDNVLVGSNVYISDHLHGFYKNIDSSLISNPHTEPLKREISTDPITIGNNVWIGDGVKILPGVNIGSGSIIGAGSVVSKNIPKNTICVGIPAKPIKKFDLENNVWVKI